MRKKVFTLVALITIVPALLSGKRQSIDDWLNFYPNQPGFYHCYHPLTGEICPDKFSEIYYDNNIKMVRYYDCPKGLYYSCKAKTCLKLTDEDMCDCIKNLGLEES